MVAAYGAAMHEPHGGAQRLGAPPTVGEGVKLPPERLQECYQTDLKTGPNENYLQRMK